MKKTIIQEAFKAIKSVAEAILGIEYPVQQSLSMPNLYSQVMSKSYEWDDWYWLVDLYIEEDTKELFAIFAKGGLLFRATVEVEKDSVSIGELQRVAEMFEPVDNSMTMMKMADGSTRWFLIASSAVLARSAVINSRELFDNLIKRCVETEEYPYLTFFHLGEAFKMGMTDWVERDGNLMLASGVFEDSELANAMISAHGADPEYWGSSISYWSKKQHQLEVIPGVKIPVHTDGVFDEISILPEHQANCFFTTLQTNGKVNLMDPRVADAISKLVGDNTELGEELISKADKINLTIDEQGLITQNVEPTSEESPAAVPTEPVVNEPVVNEPVADSAVDPEVPTDDESSTQTLVIDDAVVEEIAQSVMGKPQMATLLEHALAQSNSFATEQFKKVTDELTELRAAYIAKMDTLTARIVQLEKSEQEKKEEYVADLPRKTRTEVTFRPRGASSVDSAPETYDAIAQETVSKIK